MLRGRPCQIELQLATHLMVSAEARGGHLHRGSVAALHRDHGNHVLHGRARFRNCASPQGEGGVLEAVARLGQF